MLVCFGGLGLACVVLLVYLVIWLCLRLLFACFVYLFSWVGLIYLCCLFIVVVCVLCCLVLDLRCLWFIVAGSLGLLVDCCL